MIVRPKPSVWELFAIFRLSILTRISPQIGAVALFSIAVVWIEHRFPQAFHAWNVAPFTLLGIALSIFLGFRNNACYDRWWEARRQLGALIGEMRSLARLAVTVPGASSGVASERRRRIVLRASAYTAALMAHLRGSPIPSSAHAPFDNWDSIALHRNVPDAMLRFLAADYAAMLADGEIGEQIYRIFDDRVFSIASIQVACERILSTPTPFTYTLLLHRTAYAYCFLLPFGLVTTLGYATPVFCALVAYAFFGLDALGDELEEPFGKSLNALPLDAMARTIEISLLEALDHPNIPEPLQPVRNVLR